MLVESPELSGGRTRSVRIWIAWETSVDLDRRVRFGPDSLRNFFAFLYQNPARLCQTTQIQQIWHECLIFCRTHPESTARGKSHNQLAETAQSGRSLTWRLAFSFGNVRKVFVETSCDLLSAEGLGFLSWIIHQSEAPPKRRHWASSTTRWSDGMPTIGRLEMISPTIPVYKARGMGCAGRSVLEDRPHFHRSTGTTGLARYTGRSSGAREAPAAHRANGQKSSLQQCFFWTPAWVVRLGR